MSEDEGREAVDLGYLLSMIAAVAVRHPATETLGTESARISKSLVDGFSFVNRKP